MCFAFPYMFCLWAHGEKTNICSEDTTQTIAAICYRDIVIGLGDGGRGTPDYLDEARARPDSG